MTLKLTAALLMVLLLGPPADALAAPGAQSAHAMYTRALARERALREQERTITLEQIGRAIADYEAIVRRFPASGYCDNALWQAGNLALLAFDRFGRPADEQTAVRLFRMLEQEYPSSSLVARVDDTLEQARDSGARDSGVRDSGERLRPERGASASEAPSESAGGWGPARSEKRDSGVAGDLAGTQAAAGSAVSVIRDIRRLPLPDGMRVSIEMDGESAYHAERLDNPRRVFFDFKATRALPALQDRTLRFTDAVIREIRLGRHPKNTTRIVFDMDGVESYSVFTLYNPYRLIIDFKAATAVTTEHAPLVPSLQTPPLATAAPATVVAAPPPEGDAVLPSRPVTLPLIPPAVPAVNSDGKFSLSRQLGLGISRIVIDAGHGGHDPGALGNGVTEAELVLDVSQRLSRLLQKQTPVEVVMTRASDVFIPLEERTAIANREGADLFLSIHANASRNPQARGVETYFLNFASNPEAEEVAARENSGSGRKMHSLPEIVRAITLNNKLDESRDFAEMVQRAMTRRLASRNRTLKDLGVKQAPFVVLIGAAMPSVLAEISFVTNKQEGQLLRTSAYRQLIAEALLEAVLRYQQSLKRVKTASTR